MQVPYRYYAADGHLDLRAFSERARPRIVFTTSLLNMAYRGYTPEAYLGYTSPPSGPDAYSHGIRAVSPPALSDHSHDHPPSFHSTEVNPVPLNAVPGYQAGPGATR